jgi:hypothetical protein
MPRWRRHALRARIAAYVAEDSIAYRSSFRGIPQTVNWLRRGRYYARPDHPVGIWDRVTPSTLVLSASLTAMLERMSNDDGCPVASAIVAAMGDGRRCRTAPIGNHWSWRDRHGMVSYTPKGRALQYTDDGTWSRSGRQETTPARFARAVLRDSTLERLGDGALARFAERFRSAEQAEELVFAIVEGAEDITVAYRSSEYDMAGATLSDLPNSCMADDDVGPWYAAVGARLVVARNGRGQRARALLWESLDDAGNPIPVMDRVYAATEADREAMLSHARGMGWAHKERQSVHCRTAVLPGGRRSSGLCVAVDPDKWGRLLCSGVHVPYLDTFYRVGTDALHMGLDEDADDGIEALAQLRCTNGSLLLLGAWYEGRLVPRSLVVEDHNGEPQLRADCIYLGWDWYRRDDVRLVTACDGHLHLRSMCRQVTIDGTTHVVPTTAIVHMDRED